MTGIMWVSQLNKSHFLLGVVISSGSPFSMSVLTNSLFIFYYVAVLDSIAKFRRKTLPHSTQLYLMWISPFLFILANSPSILI